ncbi:MAG: hypothetical protein IJK24_01145, partial [Oscillospiraceae bacterium]|nr:hypothetical protein [Oscillospiraceae bacterium]
FQPHFIILQSTKDVPMYLFIIPQKQQKSKDFFLAIPNFFHFLSLPKVANSGENVKFNCLIYS